MITLSQPFIDRADADDTRRIVMAHLYYDGSNYLKVATVASVIDIGVPPIGNNADMKQYYGILSNVSGISQKWNLTSKNNVTISAPTLTLSDYQSPDGNSLQDEFFTRQYYGRRLELFLTYEGLNLIDALKIFDGFIDDVNFTNNNISIKGKTYEIPDKPIEGRELKYDGQLIGEDAVPAGYEILEELDGKFLPVPFGQHWCSPVVPYLKGDDSNHDRYLASYDTSYIGMITNYDNIRSDVYQHSIEETTTSILLENEDYFTPLHEQDWTSDILSTYEVITPGTLLPGIKIIYGPSNGHLTSDGNIYLTVPLRYKVRDDLPNHFWVQGHSGTSLITDLYKIFQPGVVTGLPWVLGHNSSDPDPLWMWVKLELNVASNLRMDETGLVRAGRAIHIPSTTSNEGGQGLLCGMWEHDTGYLGQPGLDDRAYYPCIIHHWLGDERDDFFSIPTFSTNPNYIGAGQAYYVDNAMYVSGGGQGPWVYQMNLRVFTRQYGGTYLSDQNVDIGNSEGIGLQGDYLLNGEGLPTAMGKDPFITRNSFKDNIVGAALDVYPDSSAPGSGANEFKLWRLYHATHGAISFGVEDNAYASMHGLQLQESESMISTVQNVSPHILNRCYEYVELLLRKVGVTNFHESFNYANINSTWSDLFGAARDNSGFTIVDKITALKFIREYIKDEPFTVYASEDGAYHFTMLKYQYTSNDIEASLDYDEAKKFDISMTPTKQVVSEIDKLSTDYQYGLDSYASNIHWKLDENDYDYGFWKFGNTYDDNEFILEELEKKFTSYINAGEVTYNSKYYGALTNNTNKVPPSNPDIWKELLTTGSQSAWSNSTDYLGIDAESHTIAKFYLNNRANRRRIIKFETENLSYLRFNIGDVIDFINVPHTLVGMAIKGFNGATNFEATVNGQTVYAAFIITSISKSLKGVKIEAMQCHDLDAYNIVKG